MGPPKLGALESLPFHSGLSRQEAHRLTIHGPSREGSVVIPWPLSNAVCFWSRNVLFSFVFCLVILGNVIFDFGRKSFQIKYDDYAI